VSRMIGSGSPPPSSTKSTDAHTRMHLQAVGSWQESRHEGPHTHSTGAPWGGGSSLNQIKSRPPPQHLKDTNRNEIPRPQGGWQLQSYLRPTLHFPGAHTQHVPPCMALHITSRRGVKSGAPFLVILLCQVTHAKSLQAPGP
jgi:hypothetical protein